MRRENLTVELCWIVASGRISEPGVEHEEGKVRGNQYRRKKFQGNLPSNHRETDANLGTIGKIFLSAFKNILICSIWRCGLEVISVSFREVESVQI
ncbi:hypothetical protein EUTSA_v10002136mg [Eutrema salsugineum]|uniref:Uncharacterized protein n=1 Tax=Eutrema salsugineum TaxID=72664 RepID=V4MCP6_EUTSA|nr:hypothetical protein EUTSA_v10002136mg [Eutrema salsugineum]